MEAPHEGVDGVGHGQNDESDQQHQQDEAGVALQLSTLLLDFLNQIILKIILGIMMKKTA